MKALVTLLISISLINCINAQIPQTDVLYPECPQIIDVTKAPYHAKGDGKTDDTDVIQKALFDSMGRHRLLYFPQGKYLISKTLQWSKKNSAGQDAWGKNFLQGQHAGKTNFLLKEGTFTDVKNPKAIMWCGGFGSADWFHNYVQDITFDVGKNNAGAIGLQFYSNNSGAVRRCRFVAGENSGYLGLDLGHRDMNGPLLVQHCEVLGFRRGISCSMAVNGQVFEHITLKNQTEVGFENQGQSINIRNLKYEGEAPALKVYGITLLTDANLEGKNNAKHSPAIVNYNGGKIFARDVKTSGFKRAIGDVATPDSSAAYRLEGEDKPGTFGPVVKEYSTNASISPFQKGSGSLRLEAKEPPNLPQDEAKTWANVDSYGADPNGVKDSSLAIQKAIDSGATTIFLPGSYALKQTVYIRGKVRRIVGIGGMVDYTSQVKPDFVVTDGDNTPLSIEHFANIHGGMKIDSSRTVVIRSVSDCDLTFTPKSEGGELFFEDFVTHHLNLKNQKVYARQLNVENEGTHISNDRSLLWVLGYKTERGGTLLETKNNGQSEILGGFSYTTTAGKLAPMFVTDNSSVFAFFHEVCYNNDPFNVLILEKRNQITKTIRRGEGHTLPYVTKN